MDALATEIQLNEQLAAVADELWRFLSQVQRPKLADAAWVRSVEERSRCLMAQVATLRDAVQARRDALAPTLDRLSDSLRSFRQQVSDADTAAAMRRAAASLSESYEEFTIRLRYGRARSVPWRLRLRKIKPANYARAVFHVSWGVLGAGLYQFVLTRGQATTIMLGLLALVVMVEITRRTSSRWNEWLCRTLFRHVIRPREHKRVVAASWYTLALTLLVVLVPRPAACAGALVLAFGDPVAGIFGRKWGRVKIRHEKSWVGSSAFVLAGFLAVFGLSWVAVPDFGLAARLGWSFTAALGGALAEVFSDRLDDNLTVPLAAGAVAGLWLL